VTSLLSPLHPATSVTSLCLSSLHSALSRLHRQPPLDQTDTQLLPLLPSLSSALTKELSQHNLQVLKEALLCAEALLRSWFSPLLPLCRQLVLSSALPDLSSEQAPSDLSLSLSQSLSGLLIATLHLLRHSNRSVSSSARDLLRLWFDLDLENDADADANNSSLSILFRHTCTLFQDALHLKPTGLDVLLHWLADDLLTATALRWGHKGRDSGKTGETKVTTGEESVSHLLRTLSSLLRHRDDKTRESALSAASHLLALDLLFTQRQSQLLLVPAPLTTALLQQRLSPAAAEFLEGLTTEPAFWRRAEGRVLQIVENLLRRISPQPPSQSGPSSPSSSAGAGIATEGS
jgi:hypothetical protein